MLQLTKEATRHLIEVRRERGVDAEAGARLVSNGGRVGLTFAKAPSAGDVVVEAGGIKVFVAADVTEVLQDSVIDSKETDGKRGLVMRKQAAAKARSN